MQPIRRGAHLARALLVVRRVPRPSPSPVVGRERLQHLRLFLQTWRAIQSASSTLKDFAWTKSSALYAWPTRQRKRWMGSSAISRMAPLHSGQVKSVEWLGTSPQSSVAIALSVSRASIRNASGTGTGGGSGARSAAKRASTDPNSTSGTWWAVGTAASARVGISGYDASLSAWTIATPPHRYMASRPAAPSPSKPVRTTPTTRLRQCTAAVRNRTSMEGHERFSRAPYLTRTPPSPMSRWRSGGAT